MSEAKFTPGPWMFELRENGPMVFNETGTASIAGVILYIHEDGKPYPKESEANARLIAAAPALLSALLGVMATYCPLTEEGYSDIGGVVTRARAAIAKATGQKAGV